MRPSSNSKVIFVRFARMMKPVVRRALLTLFLLAGLSGVTYTASGDEPVLTVWMVEQIKNLPHGLGEDSLILRSRHIESIQFYGAGRKSHAGFALQGLVPQAAWLQLRNRGEEMWASAAVKFKEPIDVSRYNSVVIWVRANMVRQRISLGLQDPSWTKNADAQARTAGFPDKGFTRNEIIQVVVPFNQFESDQPLNKKKLNQVTFEFGSGTVVNPKLGALDIFGIAFVKQAPPLKAIEYLSASPLAPSPVPAVQVQAPKKKPVKKKSPQQFQMEVASKQTDSPAAVAMTRPALTEPAPAPKVNLPPPPPAAAPKPVKPVEKTNVSSVRSLIISLVVLMIGSFGSILMLMRRRKPKLLMSAFGKTFFEVNWSLASSPTTPTVAEEKRFWKELSLQGIFSGWLSPFQATAEQLTPKEEYFAEKFLQRQIEFARESGVRIFPSLCFARTVFQYETFLANPRIYSFKHVAPSDRHYSDQELRTKNIGYFTVWIPPFWQRQHALPERVLVAYGKLPGVTPSSDSVQFLLTSPDLRKYAIETICRFAESSNGVRIQGAAAMLNNALTKFWHIPLTEQQRSKAGEFWAEVIRGVRARYPDFVFVADHAGTDIKLLRDLGFDFFENDQLRDTLINQIRLENVGNLASLLSGPNAMFLERSIHNLSPLIGSAAPTNASQPQSLLAALILSLLPGTIERDSSDNGAFGKFLRTLNTTPLFKNGNFLLLSSDSPAVLSFARWDQRTLYVAVANLSTQTQTASVNIQPFLSGFMPNAMYLFNDVLHGTSYLKDLPTESSGEPAVAVLGQDVHDNGLPVTLTALSLRLFSVNMKRPIRNEAPANVRQFHQT